MARLGKSREKSSYLGEREREAFCLCQQCSLSLHQFCSQNFEQQAIQTLALQLLVKTIKQTTTFPFVSESLSIPVIFILNFQFPKPKRFQFPDSLLKRITLHQILFRSRPCKLIISAKSLSNCDLKINEVFYFLIYLDFSVWQATTYFSLTVTAVPFLPLFSAYAPQI